MIILVVFKGFLLVKNLEILIQIVPDRPIYYYIDLGEHVTEIINYEKKEMILFTKEEKRSHRTSRRCYICKKKFSTDDNNKKYHKV